MIRNILFDLDGTLLFMPDLKAFLGKYMGLFTNKAAEIGYDRKKVMAALERGTAYVYANDGSQTNRERMWKGFEEVLGVEIYGYESFFYAFYRNEFRDTISETCPDPQTAQKLVRTARTYTDKVILATNPFFPLEAVRTRLEWIGLKESDFDGITSYENMSYCKPKSEYYSQILEFFDLSAPESLMVGNDVSEDIVPAQTAGLRTFLLHGCVINKNSCNYTSAEGDAEALCRYIEQNAKIKV